MSALGRLPLRAGDGLLQILRQPHWDQDVFFAGKHERGHLDPPDPAHGVVLLDDGELREIGVDRHVERGHRRGELGRVGGPLAEEGHGEGPERHVAHDEGHVDLLGEIGPHGEHRLAEGVRLAVGAGERQRLEIAWVGERVFLRDHAAHGDPHKVEAAHAEMIDQRLGVVGHQFRSIGSGRPVGLADAAIVEAQDAVAGRHERGDLEAPGQEIVGEAVDQDDRAFAGVFAVDLVVDADAIDVCGGQEGLLG